MSQTVFFLLKNNFTTYSVLKKTTTSLIEFRKYVDNLFAFAT